LVLFAVLFIVLFSVSHIGLFLLPCALRLVGFVVIVYTLKTGIFQMGARAITKA
jgi:hypothetical protein